MSGEDKFRQQLNDLVDSKEFPFEEKEWDRAVVFIARQRIRARLRTAAWTLLAVAGLAGIFAALFHIGSGTDTIAQRNANTGEPKFTSNTTVAASQEQKVVEQKYTSRSESQQRENRDTESVNTAAHGGRTAFGKTAAAKIRIDITPATPAGEHSTNKTTPVKQPGLQDDVTFTGSYPVEKGEPAASASEENSGDAEKGNTPVTSEQEQVNSATATIDPIRDAENTANVSLPAVPLTVTAVPTETTDPIREDAPAVVVTKQEAKNEATEQIAAAVPDSTTKPQLNPPVISLEAGIALNPGWNAGTREAAGINPYGSIHYRSMITEKISLSVGAQYARIAALSAYTHTSATTKLSFGEEAEVTSISPRQLHYIAAPLRVFYHFSQKNMVGIGYRFAYLLDVQSQVQTYYVRNNRQSDLKTFSSRGYTDGFAIFDSQLSLLYRRLVLNRLWIQADIHFGLTDIKDNGFFTDASVQRSNGIRIGIVFDLK